MVSEIPFNEPTVLSEQKSSSSILRYTNFRTPAKTLERSFISMAQVDSLTKTPVHLSPMRAKTMDENVKIIDHNSNSNSNDLEDDFQHSDIELSIEDSDDKETVGENDDAIINKSNENKSESDAGAIKDVELDDDLSNAAHMVRTGFSADEFDQIDNLDTVDNTSKDSNSNASNFTFNLSGLDDRDSCDSSNQIDDTGVETAVTSNVVNHGEATSLDISDVDKRDINTSDKIDENGPVDTPPSTPFEPLSKSTQDKVEPDIQKNNSGQIISKGEAGEDVSPEMETDVERSLQSNVVQLCENLTQSESHVVKSEPFDDDRSQNNTDRVENRCARSETDSSEPTEKILDSEDDIFKQKNKTSVQSDKDQESSEKPNNLKEIEDMSFDEDSTSEPFPVNEPDHSISSTNADVRLENEKSKEIEPMSVDIDPTPEETPIDNVAKSSEPSETGNPTDHEMSVDIDSTFKVILTDNDTKSNENRAIVAKYVTDINDSSKQTKKMSVDSDSSLKVISNENTNESEDEIRSSVIEKVSDHRAPDLCDNDIMPETRIRDSNDQPHSPMVVDDDQAPKSVESAEIIIDSVESEVVELDDDEDFDDVPAVTQNSHQKFSQLFENTAKEIAHDIGAEVVLGGEENIPSTSGLTSDDLRGVEISLDRLMPNENDSRKRRFESHQDDNSSKDPLVVEKRAKISKTETRDTDRKKKPSINRARKHTSSTNVEKTFQEIEKKLRGDLSKKNKKESSPGHDLFDEYDCEIHDNDGELMDDTRCDETAQSTNSDSYKIKLNYGVVSKDNLKNIFKVMRSKLTRRQLEEIVIQKCCEMISDSNEIGTLRRQVADLQQAEVFRKQKILNLEKQITQLKAVCQRYLDQVKETPGKPVTPIKITRSVGLQVARGDSSPYVNHDPNQTMQKGQEKLKKLLNVPVANTKSSPVPETRQIVPRQRTASPLPSSISNRNSDPRVMNGNARISSPLSNSSSPTPCSSPSMVNSSRLNKKASQSSDDAAVIDLTDKDDKTDTETTVATKNLLATVNGTVVTYVPVKMNSDQTRQIMKPGTPIMLNGQLMTIQSAGKYAQHPAPVPPPPPTAMIPGAKHIPPRPILKIDKNGSGIMLSWEFPPNTMCAEISKYQLFAYQETDVLPKPDLWKAVGDVSALPLPMACTLTQFVEGYKYHFIVRAVDIHKRYGPFSVPRTITL